MSIRDQIAPLEELATIDDDLRRLEEQIGKQRGSLEGMRAEAKVLEDRLRSDREMLSQMEKTRSELSVELRQMTQQIERSREKLARSRNERESNAAQREIEELRKLHRDREEEIERLNTATEAAKKSIDVTDAKHRNIVQQIEGTVEGTTRQLDDAESQRATRVKERELAVKKLPTTLYRRYESVRTRRPHPIAATHDGTCLGCHLTIPPMMFQKMLRQAEFEQCPHCRRILYYTPAPVRAPEGDAAEGSSTSSRA
ncbi:zinc ribbon domain-containing protein [Polyangium sorediatum]|uniref:C4-type zinc ribbon domain-containing protein n=1 Tax=Polyangium sorediatum TaxID=889274 RepID=A0ABT6NRS0_9BACT|nr:C4-type zinc ribbon domain-containing protein [Polyangium sorediatum]MDI1431036.1 C4-type zinc ribbon domain-containing protein [Polyangium sorediatum]